MASDLFLPVQTAACISDSIIVGFSGGKDSIVTLDLCVRNFKNVFPFFMYLVPGLSFQEAQIRWYEQKYGLEVMRIPHPMLSTWLRWGCYRKAGYDRQEITFNDIYNYVRIETGAWWIGAGERIADSIIRRAMIKKSGTVDEQRGRVYPVGHFRKADVLAYIKAKRLKLTPEYKILGYSFRGIDPCDMVKIKRHYPADYARIEAMFPFVGAGVFRYEQDEASRADEIPEI